jgi:hypothetical protein
MGSGNSKPPRSAAGGIERNRKFVDSLLEGGVWCELVSEFLESIKRGPNDSKGVERSIFT